MHWHYHRQRLTASDSHTIPPQGVADAAGADVEHLEQVRVVGRPCVHGERPARVTGAGVAPVSPRRDGEALARLTVTRRRHNQRAPHLGHLQVFGDGECRGTQPQWHARGGEVTPHRRELSTTQREAVIRVEPEQACDNLQAAAAGSEIPPAAAASAAAECRMKSRRVSLSAICDLLVDGGERFAVLGNEHG